MLDSKIEIGLDSIKGPIHYRLRRTDIDLYQSQAQASVFLRGSLGAGISDDSDTIHKR